GQEGITRALDILAAGLFGQLFGLINVDFPEVANVLGARLITLFGSSVVVELKCLTGRFHFRGQHNVWDALLRGPHQRVTADHAWQPDGRVGFLIWARPGIHVAEVEMFALPAKGARGRPGLHDELVRLLEAFPVVVRRDVVRDALAPGATHPARDQTATRDQ